MCLCGVSVLAVPQIAVGGSARGLLSFQLSCETRHLAAAGAECAAENMSDYTWTVRVERVGEKHAKAYSRNHAFVVGEQAGFEESDPHPSAVETSHESL